MFRRKQVFKRLPWALAQVKAGNTLEELLNETRQVIYSLYWEKGITKKAYNNIINSIKINTKMDPLFMNSKNSKIADPHKLLLNFANLKSNKTNLKRDKYVTLSNLNRYYAWKNAKNLIRTINWNKEF